MSSQIDFRTLPSNVPVMCIPRVYSNISESRIRRIFDDLNMGTIERIDIVSKNSEKGEKFNRVFVHFNKWNNTENACIARERLLNGKEIKIIYDDPWFWKISAYREAEKRQEASTRKSHQGRPPTTLQFYSYEEERPKYQEQRPKYQEQRQRSPILPPVSTKNMNNENPSITAAIKSNIKRTHTNFRVKKPEEDI